MTPSRHSKGVAKPRSQSTNDHTASSREPTADGSDLDRCGFMPTWAWTVAIATGLAALLLLATPVVGDHGAVPWDDARDGVRTANETVQETIDATDNRTATVTETILDELDRAGAEAEDQGRWAVGLTVDVLAEATDGLIERWNEDCPLHFDPNDGGGCVIPQLPTVSHVFYTVESLAKNATATGIRTGVDAAHSGVRTGQRSARTAFHQAKDTTRKASNLIPDEHGPEGLPGLVAGRPRLADGTTRHGERGSTQTYSGNQATEAESVTQSQGFAVPDPGNLDPTGRVAIVGYAAVTATSLILLVLYRRLSRDEVLDNDVRSAILDLVEDEPGISPTEIGEELDVAANTVIYHARILAEMDYLTTDRSGSRTQYFADGACDRRVAEVTARLRQRGKRDVLLVARREPGLSIAELARRLGKHRSTVKHHVDDLVEDGILEAERVGNGRRISVPESLRDLDVWETATS